MLVSPCFEIYFLCPEYFWGCWSAVLMGLMLCKMLCRDVLVWDLLLRLRPKSATALTIVNESLM